MRCMKVGGSGSCFILRTCGSSGCLGGMITSRRTFVRRLDEPWGSFSGVQSTRLMQRSCVNGGEGVFAGASFHLSTHSTGSASSVPSQSSAVHTIGEGIRALTKGTFWLQIIMDSCWYWLLPLRPKKSEFLTKKTTCTNVLSKRTTCKKNCQKRPPFSDGTSGQATRVACRLGRSRQGGAACTGSGMLPDGRRRRPPLRLGCIRQVDVASSGVGDSCGGPKFGMCPLPDR
jgi:hypothetical protein